MCVCAFLQMNQYFVFCISPHNGIFIWPDDHKARPLIGVMCVCVYVGVFSHLLHMPSCLCMLTSCDGEHHMNRQKQRGSKRERGRKMRRSGERRERGRGGERALGWENRCSGVFPPWCVPSLSGLCWIPRLDYRSSQSVCTWCWLMQVPPVPWYFSVIYLC